MLTPCRRTSKTWAITSYFTFDDPPGVARRLAAYRQFRERLQVPLVAVELARGDRFDLSPADAEILIQLQGGALLWQKEHLLNIALDALPPECDTVVWIYCDVALTRPDWVEAARERLTECEILQPFHLQHYLGAGESPEHLVDPPLTPDRECVASVWLRNELPPESFRTQGSAAQLRYAPGMAWAARRELLERRRFYDGMIMGSGDKAMFAAACGRQHDVPVAFHMAERQKRHFLAWAEPFFAAVQGRLGFIEGDAYHFWHGDLELRCYGTRYQSFDFYDYCPATDLRPGPNGVWMWGSEKPDLHEAVRAYFDVRKGVMSNAV